jgi:hypothetical protein
MGVLIDWNSIRAAVFQSCFVVDFIKHGDLFPGTVIGCLRKLQGWNLTAIFEEYRRYAGSKVRFLNEQVQLSLMNSTSLFLLRGNAACLLSIMCY